MVLVLKTDEEEAWVVLVLTGEQGNGGEDERKLGLFQVCLFVQNGVAGRS